MVDRFRRPFDRNEFQPLIEVWEREGWLLQSCLAFPRKFEKPSFSPMERWMRMRRCVISPCLFAGLFSVICETSEVSKTSEVFSLSIASRAPLQAPADSSGSERSLAPCSSPPTKAIAAVGEFFQRHCVKCHGKDGAGSSGRNSFPDLPDFTSASWQEQRSDAQLLTSILEGKGDDMPAFARKIKEQQARDLVAHIRAFAPTQGKSGKEKQKKSDVPAFEDRFRRLQDEMDQLLRQSRGLSQSTRPKTSKPGE
jgi:mono/diheme cytochrome c family protein